MNRAISFGVVMLLATVGSSSIACGSSDLSRKRAGELIASHERLPLVQTVTIHSRYLKRSHRNPVVGFGPITLCVNQGEPYSSAEQRLLYWRSQGLVALDSVEEYGNCPAVWSTVTLTEEGRKYLVSESNGAHEVRVFEVAFGEVTGIQMNPQTAGARADYVLKRTSITPFGTNILDEPIVGTASFARFDDGWRIESGTKAMGAIRFKDTTPTVDSGRGAASLLGSWSGSFKDDDKALLTVVSEGNDIIAKLDHNGWVERLRGTPAATGPLVLRAFQKVGFGSVASKDSLVTAQLDGTTDQGVLRLQYRDEAGNGSVVLMYKVEGK